MARPRTPTTPEDDSNCGDPVPVDRAAAWQRLDELGRAIGVLLLDLQARQDALSALLEERRLLRLYLRDGRR